MWLLPQDSFKLSYKEIKMIGTIIYISLHYIPYIDVIYFFIHDMIKIWLILPFLSCSHIPYLNEYVFHLFRHIMIHEYRAPLFLLYHLNAVLRKLVWHWYVGHNGGRSPQLESSKIFYRCFCCKSVMKWFSLLIFFYFNKDYSSMFLFLFFQTLNLKIYNKDFFGYFLFFDFIIILLEHIDLFSYDVCMWWCSSATSFIYCTLRLGIFIFDASPNVTRTLDTRRYTIIILFPVLVV